MNILFKYGVSIVLTLVLLGVAFYTNSHTGDYATQVENRNRESLSSVKNLGQMIQADQSRHGMSAPARAYEQEARLADLKSAERRLRERLEFVAASDFAMNDVPDGELLGRYNKLRTALDTSLNTTFWRTSSIRDGKTGGLGVDFNLNEEARFDVVRERLWLLDVLRRCFEMAQTYRIARVTNFSFQSTEVDFFRERVPSAIHLSSAREESVEAIGGATDMGGYLIEAPEDPFRIVYQPLSMTFYADQVEALNFLAEMARESESSTQRAIFPISWSITREPGARPGTGQYKVVLSAVAIREVQGANLGLDAISILMPNATGGFFPGG